MPANNEKPTAKTIIANALNQNLTELIGHAPWGHKTLGEYIFDENIGIRDDKTANIIEGIANGRPASAAGWRHVLSDIGEQISSEKAGIAAFTDDSTDARRRDAAMVEKEALEGKIRQYIEDHNLLADFPRPNLPEKPTADDYRAILDYDRKFDEVVRQFAGLADEGKMDISLSAEDIKASFEFSERVVASELSHDRAGLTIWEFLQKAVLEAQKVALKQRGK